MKVKVSAPALCLALLLALCFAAPVQAAGMTPTAGVVGTTVTISGLTTEPYSIKWDGVVIKQGTLLGGVVLHLLYLMPAEVIILSQWKIRLVIRSLLAPFLFSRR